MIAMWQLAGTSLSLNSPSLRETVTVWCRNFGDPVRLTLAISFLQLDSLFISISLCNEGQISVNIDGNYGSCVLLL